MSNELVYGDPSKFATELSTADHEARQFFKEAKTYLSKCVEELRDYNELGYITRERHLNDKIPLPLSSEVRIVQVEEGEEWLKLTSKFSTLELLCSHPPGSVRFMLEERVSPNSGFHPHGVEGYILFSAAQAEAKSKIESAANQKPGSKTNKSAAPAIYPTDGYLPPAFKTDSAAAFAEPLFWQLFQPLPVAPSPNKTAEAK